MDINKKKYPCNLSNTYTNQFNPLSSPEDSDIFENEGDNKDFKFLHFARKRGLIEEGKLKGIPQSRLAEISKVQDDACLV
jgi:hypothetical protein